MKLRIPDDVVYRDLAGEAVLLHLGTGIYFGLDTVGTRIWHLLAEQGDTDTIIPTLLHEYDVDEPQLRRDVDQLIRKLLDKGLLVADAHSTPTAG
jgi:hypothetical protein